MSQFWNGEVLAAPNLITVCVDESQASEISGRLYHGYSQEPQSFENVVQLIRYMADFTTAFVFRNPPWSFGSSLRKSVRWRNYMKKVWNISSRWNKTASVPPSTSLSNTARTPPGRASLHGKKDIRRWNSAVSWN